MTDETRRRISLAKKGKPSPWKGKARKHGACVSGKVTSLYAIWRGMIVRCTSPTHESAKNYFRRGIMVCEAWTDFVGFQSWALANGYQPGLSIERKESSGNYEPDNCEWITLAENGRRASVARKAREDWMVREILRLTKRVEELETLLHR